jgi:nitroimidazol reductase NimA-like FMN-containing flavoprotein (pyridoxamine 5'-phosphate oxidase superfamily)
MSSESGENRSLRQMPPNELEKRIIEFLEGQNMCVLATCTNDIPRATPIEYHSKGTTLYFVGEPGTKLKNLKINPKVSIGIFDPYIGWDSAKGAQITGRAKIISRKNSVEFKEGLAAYQWEKTAKELGLKTFPETGVELVKVEPEKIEFIDMSLKKIGYSPRQTLLCNSTF